MVPAGPVVSNSEPGFLPVTAIKQPVTCQSHCTAALRGGRKIPHRLNRALAASNASWRGWDGVGRAMRHPSLTWGALAPAPPRLKALLCSGTEAAGKHTSPPQRLLSTKASPYGLSPLQWNSLADTLPPTQTLLQSHLLLLKTQRSG